jgi:hypothetical protein
VIKIFLPLLIFSGSPAEKKKNIPPITAIKTAKGGTMVNKKKSTTFLNKTKMWQNLQTGSVVPGPQGTIP